MNFNNFDNINNNDILGYRIKEARIARGYTTDEVAKIIGVTKQSISKYENNKAKICLENLIKLSKELDFPIEFFIKKKENYRESNYENPIFFRSMRSTTKKIKYSLEQNILFIEEIYNYFCKYIDFPKFNICKNLNDGYKIGCSNEHIEKVALTLREYWGLGYGPIANMTKVLERNGIIITRFDIKTHKVDAFSNITCSGTPVIVLSNDKESAVRSRMDLAHELGHIILHSQLSKKEIEENYNTIEDEAKKFAGAFLLPDKEFSNDIYSINIDNFVYLKRKWKVSIAGMIVRSNQLNLITDDQQTYLFKRISAKKWRIQEPLDDIIEIEKPSILREAIELLLDNHVISANDLVKGLAFSTKEIEKLCFLEDDYLASKEKNKQKFYLRVIK
ncbi:MULTISPECIES: helix-turn-helix domain-containing protein [Terrisporobacter]|uniref:XRE family transcriptional regulator n=1 Tax=Terrisporobacter muris TaxID=2963284 RepID=A0A9X2M8W0_9FIRM|nr:MULTISPECIES: XRE family transcriptional regulator [Terrisporobacter]MCC3668053.1 XRE family transcriptional regulator [Terrisporobacter mayombei]MCR1821723.1 XRE family transcriptional regulator [Terrisporobacter muris]